MFIPIGDDNRDRLITPIINYLLIAANILVFFYFQDWGKDIAFTYGYATVPKEILTGRDVVTASQVITDQMTGQQYLMPGLQPTHGSVYLTLITSMFMHGGL